MGYFKSGEKIDGVYHPGWKVKSSSPLLASGLPDPLAFLKAAPEDVIHLPLVVGTLGSWLFIILILFFPLL